MKTLIADDDPTTRILLRAVLSKGGYEVIEARDGNEAWDHLTGPDAAPLAIVDWVMPGLSGPELCHRLKGREGTAGPYVILLTSRAHWQDVVRGLEAGADDFVAKPYQIPELRARIAVGRRIVSLRQELMALNDQLEHRVQERTERIERMFVRNQELIVQLGHDLRTPLTPLMALLPMLVADAPEGERRESLSLCLEQAVHLKRLAEQVFELGRLEAPGGLLDIRDVELGRVAQAAMEILGAAGRDGPARAMSEIPATLTIRGDMVWLRRVFENLLDNAIRFSPIGSVVVIRAELREGNVVISVTDHGCGLERDQLERVFDPFYTGDASRHNRHTSGLGLALCRRIVERHGGRIWAESAGIGLGTSVRFDLPLADTLPAPTPDSLLA